MLLQNLCNFPTPVMRFNLEFVQRQIGENGLGAEFRTQTF